MTKDSSRVTSSDVARKAGVSRATVSGYINGTRNVAPATALRIEAAFRELSYRPDSAARALRGKPANTVGLIVPNSASPFWGVVVKTAEATARELGYNLILGHSGEDPAVEDENIGLLTGEHVSGILFAPTGRELTRVGEVSSRIPMVQVARRLDGYQVDSVVVDNFAGGAMATKHLAELGYSRIACVGAALDRAPTKHRLDGYLKTLDEFDIRRDDDLIISTENNPEGGHLAAQELLSLSDPPDSIVLTNHLLVFGVLRAAMERGVAVPGQLGVIAYDETAWAPFVQPPLTVVSQPVAEVAAVSTRLLVSRIEEQRRQAATAPQHVVCAVGLIDRESCGRSELHHRSSTAAWLENSDELQSSSFD